MLTVRLSPSSAELASSSPRRFPKMQRVTLTTRRFLEPPSRRRDVLVSGDKDLLILGSFESIPILSPRQFHDRFLSEPR